MQQRPFRKVCDRTRLSRQFINEYRAELDRLRTVSGSQREIVLCEAFKNLFEEVGPCTRTAVRR